MASSRFVFGMVISGGFHVLAFVHLHDASASERRVLSPLNAIIEIDAPPPAKIEPSEVMEPAALTPAIAPSRPIAPSHAVAQAGHVLAAAADDARLAVADFTMVQGMGAYAGGVTSSVGASKTAVTSAPSRTVSANSASGESAAPTGRDLSKPARTIGSDWDCKALFPTQAKDASATVLIVVRVRPEGTPESVSIIADPGQGFGQAARACAMRQRYLAAEDREGRKIPSTTTPFRVRFTR